MKVTTRLRSLVGTIALATIAIHFAGAQAAAASGPRFVAKGKWDYSSIPGYEDDRSTIWTQEVGASASWFPGFDGPARARVSLHKVVHPSKNDTNVQIEVIHGGKTESRAVDFSEGSTGWLELGTISFVGDPGECVRLTKVTGTGATRASAVRFDVLGEGESAEAIQSIYVDDLAIKPANAAAADLIVDPAKVREGPPPGDWQLAFSDEFDGDKLDTSKWQVESGAPGHILSSRWPENVQVKDGLLRLLTKKEARQGRKWTTGNVWTRGFFPKYGFLEARMRIGKASGLNNAFWLMTEKSRTEPGHFEIDIVEAHSPNRLHATLHNWSGEHWARSKFSTVEGDLSDAFHLYALQWDQKELVFYFDGQPYFRTPNDIAHDASPVRLSSAVGQFAGRITDALDGTAMEVDWVRVYQSNEADPEKKPDL